VDEPAITSAPPLSARPKSLVFISHDSRDADLAEAFATMLASVSAGTLKSFRSSDKKGGSGIGFGEEWYTAIMSRLAEATDVVALLTPQSVDRPWILYEAGVAKGKLDTTVLGIALGVPLDKVSTGPFGQFQNCGDDEDSMTGLVLQLLSRNPDAAPLEEAVRMQVRIFKGKLEALLAEKGQGLVKTSAPEDDQSAAKLFEEVKAMVRELPDRVEGRVRSITKRGSLRKSHFNPGMLDDLLSSFREEEDQIASWLILISFYREDFPWLYEAGMDVHRALQNAPRGNLIRTARAFTRLAEFTSRSSYIREYISEDKETYFLIRHLPEIAQRFLNDVIERRKMNVILK
jgi:hypothetical protein